VRSGGRDKRAARQPRDEREAHLLIAFRSGCGSRGVRAKGHYRDGPEPERERLRGVAPFCERHLLMDCHLLLFAFVQSAFYKTSRDDWQQ
jgi:hypothetical protein